MKLLRVKPFRPKCSAALQQNGFVFESKSVKMVSQKVDIKSFKSSNPPLHQNGSLIVTFPNMEFRNLIPAERTVYLLILFSLGEEGDFKLFVIAYYVFKFEFELFVDLIFS